MDKNYNTYTTLQAPKHKPRQETEQNLQKFNTLGGSVEKWCYMFKGLLFNFCADNT